MKLLITSFLKIFFRNRRAIFFVILLPVAIFLITVFLGLGEIVRFQKPIRYQDFLVTGIIAFAVMQTGIYTVAYTFIDYHHSHVFKRLAVTPLTPPQLLFSQELARFLVALLQVLLLLGIAVLKFGTSVRPSLIFLPLLIFVGNHIFLNIGFLIASFCRDYEQAAPYTAALGMGLVFLGDIFFPVENLPLSLTKLAEVLPLKPFVSMIRYAALGFEVENFLQQVLILLLWFVVLSFIGQLVFEKKAYK